MLSFFPRDVLDEIWDLIESVSEGFLPTLAIKLSSESTHQPGHKEGKQYGRFPSSQQRHASEEAKT